MCTVWSNDVVSLLIIVSEYQLDSITVRWILLALGGTKPDENFDEANKRHTMSHPPDHIPDMDNMSPAKTKSPKDKKDKKDKIKDKVSRFIFTDKYCI